MKEPTKFRVLIIDDEAALIDSFQSALRSYWEIQGITDPAELERDMKGGFTKFRDFDLIFLDLLFDKNKAVTRENVQEKLDKKELMGIQFLRWLQENYSHPIVVLSGNLFNKVAEKLRADYPHILLKSKPVDLHAADFRHNMEWYAQNFYRFKREVMFDKLASDALTKTDETAKKA